MPCTEINGDPVLLFFTLAINDHEKEIAVIEGFSKRFDFLKKMYYIIKYLPESKEDFRPHFRYTKSNHGNLKNFLSMINALVS